MGRVERKEKILMQQTWKDKSRSLGFLALLFIQYGKNNDTVEASVSLTIGVAAARYKQPMYASDHYR